MMVKQDCLLLIGLESSENLSVFGIVIVDWMLMDDGKAFLEFEDSTPYILMTMVRGKPAYGGLVGNHFEATMVV